MKKIYFDILKTLEDNGYEAYIVGGFVRDKLLGKESSDIDMCTSATPKDMLKIFKNNIKIVEEYGAVKLKLNDNVIDITTFRTEENYLNNKPTNITYIKSLKEDLIRRDFTINTICLDKDSNIIDLLNGKTDLYNKLLRVVGNVEVKMKEDTTRMLRSLRFMSLYDFELEDELYEYIISHKEDFSKINYMKRKEEMEKLFKRSKVKPFLDFIKKYDIEEYLGIKSNNFVETKTVVGVWAQLDFDDNYQFNKLEKESIDQVKELVKKHFIEPIDVYKYGLYITQIAGDILHINKEEINQIYQSLPIKNIKELNISFEELESILGSNINKKQLGQILKKLETFVINGTIENKREKLIEKAMEIKTWIK